MRRRGVAWIGVLALLVAFVPRAGADHVWESHIAPQEPERDFPTGFVAPVDAQASSTFVNWEDARVGGWGGDDCDREIGTPVVFVHGNSEDAWFWREAPSGDGTIVDVREEFLDADYCPDELWAISYTGAAGYTTSNDVNFEDVDAFIDAVLANTEASKVDVVAHSLGVTVVRRAGQDDTGGFYGKIRRFVAIAGPNHGAATCRGARTATGPAGLPHDDVHVSHVCEEIEPGSPWLDDLNAPGETPGETEYLTIYEGSGTTDTFYLGPLDADSPRLEGADCNHEMPFTAHNTLARGEKAVGIYLEFLKTGTHPCPEDV